jgi:hypothetical protein
MKQPRALVLADILESNFGKQPELDAAAELRRLHQFELAHEIWCEKTEWVQHTAQASELGLHRADVLWNRIEDLVHQRNTLMRALKLIKSSENSDMGQIYCKGVAVAAIAKVEKQP